MRLWPCDRSWKYKNYLQFRCKPYWWNEPRCLFTCWRMLGYDMMGNESAFTTAPKRLLWKEILFLNIMEMEKINTNSRN